MWTLDKYKVLSRLQELMDDYLVNLNDVDIYRTRVEVRHLMQDIVRGHLNDDIDDGA